MIIDIEDNLLKGLTVKEAKLNLAIGLFIDNKLTLGQGAEMAELSQLQFQRELGKRKIQVHYSLEDLKEDVETIKSLNLL